MMSMMLVDDVACCVHCIHCLVVLLRLLMRHCSRLGEEMDEDDACVDVDAEE